MRTIRSLCRLALPVGALLICGLGWAGAQGVVDVRQACAPDAMRLCNDFIPDEGKVKTCMLAKRAQLSVECRTAMGGGHVGRHRSARTHCGRHSRHCG
jgi:hypothetical protein